VLNAQRQLYAAVRDYNDARYDYILDNLKLKQAAGTLSPSDLQGLAIFLKQDYDPDRDFLPPELMKPPYTQTRHEHRRVNPSWRNNDR
jgi:outer membrane protein